LSLSEKVGRQLREHVVIDDDPSASAHRRAQFVAAATRRRSRAPAWTVAAVAAAALIAIFGLARRQVVVTAAPITFAVGDDARPGELGAYVASATGLELPLRFSDGSELRLQGAARARVTGTTAAGASVLLETGRMKVDVAHRPHADWAILSGPYTVQVTGTSFYVMWEPASGTLEVEMNSGAVVVRGPGIESGARIAGTERFVTSVSARIEAGVLPPVASGATALSESSSPGVAVAEPTIGVPDHERHGVAGTPAVNPSPSMRPMATAESAQVPQGPAQSWASLTARGDHARVIGEADARGIDVVMDSASAEDLGALADAARYTGRRDLARRALLALRSRFRSTPRGESASFLLGRLMDDGGSSREAIEWYDRYLSEAPAGPFVPEALGRRMLALRRLGDLDACRRAADDYLRRFPGGPYAGVASEIAHP